MVTLRRGDSRRSFRLDSLPSEVPGARLIVRWVPVLQIAIVVVAAVVSVVLRRRVPVELGLSPYDGLLFARNARTMEHGAWLGTFSPLTLAKGPGYPLFIAVSHAAGIELKVAEQVVYLAAVATVALAVLAVSRRRWLATGAFVVLALDPANFSGASSSIMRDNVFASLGLLAVGLGFLTSLGVVRQSRWWWLVAGASGTGATGALYWLTREEGATLLPPLGLAVAGVLLVAWWARRRRKPETRLGRPSFAKAGVALALTALAAVAPLAFVRAENSARYGAALDNDMAEGAFLRAYADWSRVEAGPRAYRIPITADQRAAVYPVSAAARELRPQLEALDNRWRHYGCQDMTRVCDYAGGWMVWAIRDAAASAGHFRDEAGAQRFFTRLSQEIVAACDDGRLRCAATLPASLQPIQRAPLGLLAHSFVTLSKDLITVQGLYETPGVAPNVPLKMRVSGRVRAEYLAVVDGIPVDAQAAAAQSAIFAGRRWQYELLGNVYRVLVPLLVITGIGGAVTSAVRTVRRREAPSYLLVLALALAAGVAIRLFLLALIHTAEYDAAQARYQFPGYFLMMAFGVVGIAAGLRGPRSVEDPARKPVKRARELDDDQTAGTNEQHVGGRRHGSHTEPIARVRHPDRADERGGVRVVAGRPEHGMGI
ncbi:MAG: rane protein of unknown function [Frankiales bacterium]|nr:rane protein of unknown function [Frankiales bacterium]